MDREALALRNRRLAEAYHAPTPRHHLRRVLLQLAGRLPVLPSQRASSHRILLVRPDHLGDVLLTMPAVQALRAAKPYVELHALVGPWSAEAVAAYPEVDQVLTLSFPGFDRQPKPSWRSPYEQVIAAARHLRRIGYGSAVIFRPDHWWGALLAKLAGIPERIGYDLPDVAPFLTAAVEYQPQHAVRQSLRLVEGWCGPLDPSQVRYYFPVEATSQAYVDGYLQEWGITPSRRLICIHPGSGAWVKHWQEDRWARVADALAEQLDAPVVFSGSAHELNLARRIADHMRRPACIMAGDTRISQLAALFQRAYIVLGPDSGPLHLAAAVGVPTIALFGPADPAEFATWGPPNRQIILTTDIACRPCRVLDWMGDDPAYHPCVRDITVARVLEAARRALNPG